MNRAAAAPRGQLLQGRAAGRDGVSTGGGFPQRRVYHTGPRGGRVYANTPQGRRCVGRIARDADGRLLLRKDVDERVHLLRLPCEGWAIQASALEEAERLRVERVEVYELGTGRRWWCLLADFGRFGVPFDRGHGKQVALPLRFWSFHPGPMRESAQPALLEAGR